VRVTHLSPTTFGSAGIYGGGERYPLELARAMSTLVPTRFVSFGPRLERTRLGDLDVLLLPVRARWRGGALNPLSERLLGEFRRADVLHTHQYETVLTSLSLLRGATSRTTVFCTDHGGRSPHLNDRLRLDKALDGFLAVSQFSVDVFPRLADMATVIHGGVDTERYAPGPEARKRKVVFVGRLLPHKGVDVLIRALPPGLSLAVYGRSYDSDYLDVLHRLAEGRDVTFHHSAPDEEIVAAYRTALVSVLPSVYESPYGPPAPRSELLGLALLEAMACGTPVIATNVGGMPEIVEATYGRVVPPGNVEALRAALDEICATGSAWDSMSEAALTAVRQRFTWLGTAQRCLQAYERPRRPRAPAARKTGGVA
jgi:glycosyltransferase involved in cell wall biosynthesis